MGSGGRRDVLRRRLDHLALPQAGLKEGGVESCLQLGRAEGVDVRRLREEAQQKRHAQVGHGEVLEEQLRLPRPERAVKAWKRLEVQHILLGLDADLLAHLRLVQRRRVGRRGRCARLLLEPEHAAQSARDPRVFPLVELLLQRGGRESSRAKAGDDEALGRVVSPREGGVERQPRVDLGQRLGGGHHQQLEDEDDVAEEPELGVVLQHEPRLAREVERQQVARRLGWEGRV